ncbi:methanogen output domain 1-containing protein [Wenxinia marina]|nr:methanogen output domain 1-containing protein [Wenxinia marina]
MDVDRDRERFFESMLTDLAEVLETNVGIDLAEGFIALVGHRTAAAMNADYRAAAGKDRLNVAEVAAALVDLKRRIEGGFRVESLADDRIVLVNDRCPFGRAADGKPSLCMMTSNVFGRIAADNLGYAHVLLEETIAKGAQGCRVVIHLDGRGPTGEGREYFG